MKYVLTTLALMLLASCQTLTDIASSPVPVTISPLPESTKVPLAWGTNHADWDEALTEAVKASDLKDTVKHPCKALTAKQCLVQALSIMSKYESSFKPETSYTEAFADANGVKVVSRGLLQLSQESANQKRYGCNIKQAKDLHIPKVNLECAVKIAVTWINQDGAFFGNAKDGLGRYWSVGRVSSGSNAKILTYLQNL